MKRFVSSRAKLGLALLVSSLASVLFYFMGAAANDSFEYGYLIWNLFLAWIPLGLTLWLERTLRTNLWSSWRALIITALWLGFLPNSFYVISDFVHLTEVPRVDIVMDVVMFGSFALNGLILGYISLFTIHTELRKRMRDRNAGIVVAGALLLSSFAIYIGRDLRWNTWDVLFNPASVLFDVSDRLLHPRSNSEVFTITLSFFIMLSSTYLVIWHVARALRQQKISR